MAPPVLMLTAWEESTPLLPGIMQCGKQQERGDGDLGPWPVRPGSLDLLLPLISLQAGNTTTLVSDPVVDRMVPKSVYVLISRTCEYSK